MTSPNAENPTCHFCGVPVHSPAYHPDVPEVCKFHWRKLRAVAPPHIINAYRRRFWHADPRNYIHKMRFEEALDGLQRYMQRIQEQHTN